MCCSEAGAVDVSRPRPGHARPPRPGPDAVRRPDAAASCSTHELQGAAGRRRARTPAGRPTACATSTGGRAVGETPRARRARAPPGRLRLHRRGAGHGAAGPWPPTPRSPPSRWATTRPCPTWPAGPRPIHHYLQAALRPGHQPAHRPPARAAGDEPAHAARPPPAASSPRRPRRPGCSRCESFFLYPSAVARLLRRARAPTSASAASTPPSRSPTAPTGCGPRSSACATRPRPWSRAAPASLVIDDGGVGAERAPVPSLLATGAVHHRLDRGRACAADTSLVVVGRRRARRARHRLPARLRRRRHLPAPRPRDRRRRGRRDRGLASCRRPRPRTGSRPPSRTAC